MTDPKSFDDELREIIEDCHELRYDSNNQGMFVLNEDKFISAIKSAILKRRPEYFVVDGREEFEKGRVLGFREMDIQWSKNLNLIRVA